MKAIPITPPILGKLFDEGYFTPERCKTGDHAETFTRDDGLLCCAWCGAELDAPYAFASIKSRLVEMDARELRDKAIGVWSAYSDLCDAYYDRPHPLTQEDKHDLWEVARIAEIVGAVASAKFAAAWREPDDYADLIDTQRSAVA